jgi:hypothetical protein
MPAQGFIMRNCAGRRWCIGRPADFYKTRAKWITTTGAVLRSYPKSIVSINGEKLQVKKKDYPLEIRSDTQIQDIRLEKGSSETLP